MAGGGGGGGGRGGYIIKCGIFLHLNTSRLLIITIWNRILISTCIACRLDLMRWGHLQLTKSGVGATSSSVK